MPWTECVSSSGRSYLDWKKPVPRIPDFVLNSIIYLYDDRINAETGADSGGSGFLVSMPSEVRDHDHMYAVTNAHVIDEGFSTVRFNLRCPSSGYVRTEIFRWFRMSESQ